MHSSTVMAIAVATALSTAAAFAADTTKTQIVVFSATRMHASAALKGTCWTDSIAVDRLDAFRCMAGNTILDPCFVRAAGQVACPTDLLGNRGALLQLQKPLPKHAGRNPKDNVWAFQLQSGALCRIGTGTINPGYPYYCSTPPVCSEPRPSSDPARYESRCGRPQNQVTVTEVRLERVTKIWK